jgi:anti-anti-sigma factor
MSGIEKGPRERIRARCELARSATAVITPPFVDFAMVVTFDTDHATIAVRGEVDLLTAPTLHGAIEGLVGQGHTDIVLDLAEMTFMDASGLGVIADISARLSTSSHALIVRSAPAMTRRILYITRLNTVVRLETQMPRVANIDAAELASTRVGLTPNLALIDAALRRVTELVSATIGGADGVSITLERDGQLATVAASNETVMIMDGHQYETGEGPCLSAAAHGRGYHIDSLATETRWPEFVPLALEQGIASIMSTPLMTIERPLGALNIYSNAERIFGPQQQELASLFASHASAILTDSGATDEQMNTRLADALVTRQTIARAQGVLMARENISADGAAASIHRSARTAGVDVALQAATIVASTHNDTSSEK